MVPNISHREKVARCSLASWYNLWDLRSLQSPPEIFATAPEGSPAWEALGWVTPQGSEHSTFHPACRQLFSPLISEPSRLSGQVRASHQVLF